MTTQKPVVTLSAYENQVHKAGRLWAGMALAIMLMIPAAICIYFDAWPPLSALLKALVGVLPMYWTVGIIEVFTFVPMLGTGGSYLGFVTGNLTNLKVPAALNALQAANVRAGTEEGDVISTIAIASSSIITTLIIALGVFLLGSLQPVLESPALKPAFDNILPALFGALGVVFISKNPKIAIAPLLFMVVLFMLVPSLSKSVSILVPVGALIAIGVARVLYKQGKLGKKA
ncbi:MAG: hypothetical protein GX171_09635 [Clostridiales bacterium]|jgi:hypothetical protein|nr:hypothetical protein [Clostridiales bacterium]